jgi:hypothetical protein
MEKERYVNPKEAARIIGVAEQTLANLRCMGLGPVYYKPHGRMVRYKVQDLFDYMNAGRVDPEARGEAV